MASPKRLVRFDVYVKRHPSLSVEEFHHHWTNIHAPLIKNWLQRHGVYRYTQYHTPPSMRGQYLGGGASGKAEGESEGSSILDFDGHGEILVESTDTLTALRDDPYYKQVVEPDEEKLIDKKSVVRTVGYEEVWVQDGKVV